MNNFENELKTILQNKVVLHIFSPEKWHGLELTHKVYAILLKILKDKHSTPLTNLIDSNNFINLSPDIPYPSSYTLKLTDISKTLVQSYIEDFGHSRPQIFMADQTQAYYLSRQNLFTSLQTDFDLFFNCIIVHHKNELSPADQMRSTYTMHFSAQYEQYNIIINQADVSIRTSTYKEKLYRL